MIVRQPVYWQTYVSGSLLDFVLELFLYQNSLLFFDIVCAFFKSLIKVSTSFIV